MCQMKKILLVLVAACFLTACNKTVYPLNESARHVQVVDYIRPELRAKLKEIDMVRCNLGQNFNSLEANIDSCKNQMRNQAAAMGGDIVYLEHKDQTISKPTTNFGLSAPMYETNIIELRGIVYKILKHK